jgi:hypothetical protein
MPAGIGTIFGRDSFERLPLSDTRRETPRRIRDAAGWGAVLYRRNRRK